MDAQTIINLIAIGVAQFISELCKRWTSRKPRKDVAQLVHEVKKNGSDNLRARMEQAAINASEAAVHASSAAEAAQQAASAAQLAASASQEATVAARAAITIGAENKAAIEDFGKRVDALEVEVPQRLAEAILGQAIGKARR